MTADGNLLTLENAALRVVLDPLLGGTIVSVRHRALEAEVLGTTPWDPLPGPCSSAVALDGDGWLAHYGGGWPLLFPNGGDACAFEGANHGFHGEASVTSWQVEREDGGLLLRRRFFTVPVEMHRRISLDGDVLVVHETVRFTGATPRRVMWTHHPSFGGDLLDSDFVIETGARTVTVDDRYDPPSNPLIPAAAGTWPEVPGKAGPIDLAHPSRGPMASLVYLSDFAAPWVAVRRSDGAVGATLSWDDARFPCLWLWYELGGSEETPWHGSARLLGVEPSTSWPGNGLADIARRGGPLLTLEPGAELSAFVRLHVTAPTGPVRGIDGDGRAIFAPEDS